MLYVGKQFAGIPEIWHSLCKSEIYLARAKTRGSLRCFCQAWVSWCFSCWPPPPDKNPRGAESAHRVRTRRGEVYGGREFADGPQGAQPGRRISLGASQPSPFVFVFLAGFSFTPLKGKLLAGDMATTQSSWCLFGGLRTWLRFSFWFPFATQRGHNQKRD